MKRYVNKYFCLLISVIFLLCGCGKSEKAAFSVNGADVSKEELVFYMRRSSDEVIASVEQEYGLDSSMADFWNKPAGDSTPLDILKKTAEKEIIRSKVLILEARKYGFNAPLLYKEQQENWKKDNDERLKSEEAGETVYGATLRSFYTYLSMILSELENGLKEKLEEKGVIAVSESEMKKYYSENPDYFKGENNSFESVSQSIHIWIINEKFEDYIDGLCKSSKVEYSDMSVDTDLLN